MAGLLLVGQTLGRQIFLDSVEYPTLRALGMTRGQLVGAALVSTNQLSRSYRSWPLPPGPS